VKLATSFLTRAIYVDVLILRGGSKGFTYLERVFTRLCRYQ